MGKTFITDEVDDGFTAKVSEGGAIHVVNHNSYYHVTASISAGSVISTAPCWLQSVTVNTYPLTATTISVLDAAASSSAFSAGALTHASRIARIALPVAGTSANADYPKTLLYNLYCATGLTVCVTAGDVDATVVYKTA